MKEYVTVDGKELRLGYTTGSCAAAASKAAAIMLLTGKELQQIRLLTPKGIELELEVEDITTEKDAVSCAIRKDSGDDPDVTHGALVYSRVSYTDEPGIVVVRGGENIDIGGTILQLQLGIGTSREVQDLFLRHYEQVSRYHQA